MSILISLQVVGFWGNVPQNITGESKRPPLIISCFLHYKRYRSSQSGENHLLALCKLFSQLIQIKSFPLQSISSPDANPLQIIFSPGETILGFNEPDHDEHPLSPGLTTYHFPQQQQQHCDLLQKRLQKGGCNCKKDITIGCQDKKFLKQLFTV